MTVRLDNKRIFVSGGSRGLGRACCIYFAKQGADVVFCYAKNGPAAEEALQSILSYGVQGMALKGSVADEESVRQMAREVQEKWDGIDILVNNAGVSQAIPFALLEQDDWRRIMQVNVDGVYLLTRAFLKGMVRARNGVILNIGSLAGTRMIEAPVHYCTSKAAIKGLTEALSKEVGRYNIRVNCLAPGLLEEGVADNLPGEQLNEFLEQLALGRVGTLDEVAALACFMISDRNKYMNGTTILMDGGF